MIGLLEKISAQSPYGGVLPNTFLLGLLTASYPNEAIAIGVYATELVQLTSDGTAWSHPGMKPPSVRRCGTTLVNSASMVLPPCRWLACQPPW